MQHTWIMKNLWGKLEADIIIKVASDCLTSYATVLGHSKQRNSVYTHAIMKAGKLQYLHGISVNCRLGELIVYIPVWVWRSENQESQWWCYCPRPAHMRPRRSWCPNVITFRQEESRTWVEGQPFCSIHAFNWLSTAHQLRESNLLY